MWKSWRYLIVSLLCTLSGSLSAGINVAEDLVHQYTLEKGGRISGQVTITNMGLEETMVKIEICDYRTDFNGQVAFDPPNSHDRSLATWLTVGASSFVLGAGEQRIVPYEVAFTEEEKPPGAYWSSLLISPEPRYKPTKQGMGLATIVRYAVIILGNVKGEAEASITIPDHGLEEKLEERFCWFHIENNGETVLRPKIVLELINGEGEVVFVTPPSPDGFLFPLSSSRVRFKLTDAPIGEFTGLLTVDAGEDRVFGAQYPFKIQPFNPYEVDEKFEGEGIDSNEENLEVDAIELTEHVRAQPNLEEQDLVGVYRDLTQKLDSIILTLSPSPDAWWDSILQTLEQDLDGCYNFSYA
ncbi:hypothetical protein HAT2_00177 [Candidatus Similichlamydia laticola]|uniref:Uncharacterized protein n=2 Tax=Candidatus Similichlamydia laticola TaxID=2170265 RepID=A0A369KAN5_9BACT|nr:hypothetical protein HAT2_00177 [Candidatus Similichlamydia laticola]